MPITIRFGQPCCGPTATVLADRLTRKGIWAVDLGNFGKFL